MGNINQAVIPINGARGLVVITQCELAHRSFIQNPNFRSDAVHAHHTLNQHLLLRMVLDPFIHVLVRLWKCKLLYYASQQVLRYNGYCIDSERELGFYFGLLARQINSSNLSTVDLEIHVHMAESFLRLKPLGYV